MGCTRPIETFTGDTSTGVAAAAGGATAVVQIRAVSVTAMVRFIGDSGRSRGVARAGALPLDRATQRFRYRGVAGEFRNARW